MAFHLKTVFQKGAPRTEAFATVLGYPAEVVPLANPYALGIGDTLLVRCLADGRPVVGAPVFAGGTRPSGAAIPARRCPSSRRRRPIWL